MEDEIINLNGNQDSKDDDTVVVTQKQNNNEPKHKKLRSQPPDIIVAVGSGTNQKEFECYSQILCFASEYFDTMLSAPMRERTNARIEFPDKDPEEWKLFFNFIDPSTSHSTAAQVNKDNVFILAPWFHEHQMDFLFEQCDEIARTLYTLKSYLGVDEDILVDSIWRDVSNPHRTVETVERMFEYLAKCASCQLKKGTEMILSCLITYLRHDGYSLLENNINLIQTVAETYQMHKDLIETVNINDPNPFVKFHKLIIQGKSIDDDGDDDNDNESIVDWESLLFQRLVQERVQYQILKSQYKATSAKLERFTENIRSLPNFLHFPESTARLGTYFRKNLRNAIAGRFGVSAATETEYRSLVQEGHFLFEGNDLINGRRQNEVDFDDSGSESSSSVRVRRGRSMEELLRQHRENIRNDRLEDEIIFGFN